MQAKMRPSMVNIVQKLILIIVYFKLMIMCTISWIAALKSHGLAKENLALFGKNVALYGIFTYKMYMIENCCVKKHFSVKKEEFRTNITFFNVVNWMSNFYSSTSVTNDNQYESSHCHIVHGVFRVMMIAHVQSVVHVIHHVEIRE